MRKPQSKPIEMLLLFGFGRSLIDQIPDIWSIRGSSSIKTEAYLVLVDAVARIFLLFRPTHNIMTCNDPQLQLAWYFGRCGGDALSKNNLDKKFVLCQLLFSAISSKMYN
jgi:hypothetical protein